MANIIIDDSSRPVHQVMVSSTFTDLTEQMNVPVPNLPPYDPAKDEPFPWEADVRAAIEKLRAEKDAKQKGEGSGETSV